MMRPGLDAPTEVVPADVLARLRAFLDRQRPIGLAVWVRHEQRAPEGPVYDHHTMLGVDDELYAGADARALEHGVELECPMPGWLDLYPLSEVEPLRGVGEILWARGGDPGDSLDPLDFRFTRESITVAPEARAAFVRLVQNVAPTVVRVHAYRTHLWKGERKLRSSASLHVGWDGSRGGAANTLTLVLSAAREAGLPALAGTLGRPVEPPPYATVLYDEVADA